MLISPFGQTGPRANDPASDLTLMYSSGIARLLTGQVDDLAEAPIRPVGEQSAFIGGLAAACAGMHSAQPHMTGAVDRCVDRGSAGDDGDDRAHQRRAARPEPLAQTPDRRQRRHGLHPAGARRLRRDFAARGSPMGSVAGRDGLAGLGRDPRFATKADRVANWDALHALMSEWSRQHDKQWIADTAQAARVPSFPLRELAEQLESPQLAHRGFWRAVELVARAVQGAGCCRSG